MPATHEAVAALLTEVTRPAHFFLGPQTEVEWQDEVEETISWELHRGRLLDRAHCRQQRTFRAWNLYLLENGQRSGEPLLAVKWDAERQEIHVVRAILSYAWEGYDSGGGVFLSREVRKWVRELVATIPVTDCADLEDLHDDLICQLFLAVVGVSRLPLTSLEAPLPAFTFGELAYVYQPNVDALPPMRTPQELIERGWSLDLALLERVKLLETLLRATPREQLTSVSDLLVSRTEGKELLGLVLSVFNFVSLSPVTDFAEKALLLLSDLETRHAVPTLHVAEVLAWLILRITRHLTAYDLVTFHHFGANYHDALLLDALLKQLLQRLEAHPKLAETALLRRALRQGLLVRTRYEGHLVPEVPTSQGENARVLPASHPRVDPEQITNPVRRNRRLFQDEPWQALLRPVGRRILAAAPADLEDERELRELGLALFLDRPLGSGKHPAEPDQTPLLSYQAFSRFLAQRRLSFLVEPLGWIDRTHYARLMERLNGLAVIGVALADLPPGPPTATVSLDDARKVSDDFVLLRTGNAPLRELFELFDVRVLIERYHFAASFSLTKSLVVRDPGRPCGVNVYDSQHRKRLELTIETTAGYRRHRDLEVPAGGLRVLRFWEEREPNGPLHEMDLRDAPEPLLLRPRV